MMIQTADLTSIGKLSIGGFLPSTECVSNTIPMPIARPSNTLLEELKYKEHEIIEITHNLKATQALEQAQQSELARQAEEIARKSAEQKTLHAQEQAERAIEFANQAATRIKDAVTKTQIAEQARFEEEQGKRIFEEKVQQTIRQINVIELTRIQEEKARLSAEEKVKCMQEKANALETTLEHTLLDLQSIAMEKNTLLKERNQTEQQIIDLLNQLEMRQQEKEQLESEMHTRENALLEEKTTQVELLTQELKACQCEWINAQAHITNLEDKRKKEHIKQLELDMQIIELTEQLQIQEKMIHQTSKALEKLTSEYALIEDYAHELQIQNDELQTKQLTLITELNTFKHDCLHFQQYSQALKTHNEILQTDLETLENTQRTLDDENHHFSEKIRKLETIVVSERKLRKLFEEKTKIALQQAYTSELARQQEEHAKKVSEEKTRRALDQAGKAMMHFISDGLQTQLTSSYDHAS